MPFAFTTLLLILATIPFPTPVFADPPSNDRQSRENRAFEAQGTLTGSSLSEVIDWIARNHLFSDGVLSTGYNLIVRPEDLDGNPSGLPNPQSHHLVMQIETRLYAHCPFSGPSYSREDRLNRDGTCPTTSWQDPDNVYGPRLQSGDQGTVGQVLPFEMSMSLQMNDPQSVSVQRVRAGAYRFIIQALGITVQLGTYTFENYRHQLGVRHGFSPVSVTINEAFRLDRNGRVAVVLRGFLEGDVGTTVSQLPALEAARRAAGWQGNGAIVRWGGRVQGSVGIRFFDRILLEFMGGAYVQDSGERQQFIRETRDADGSLRSSYSRGGDHITQTFIGGGVRFRMMDSLFLTGSLIQNTYDLGTTYTGQSRVTPTDPSLRPRDEVISADSVRFGASSTRDLSGWLGLEVRW